MNSTGIGRMLYRGNMNRAVFANRISSLEKTEGKLLFRFSGREKLFGQVRMKTLRGCPMLKHKQKTFWRAADVQKDGN